MQRISAYVRTLNSTFIQSFVPYLTTRTMASNNDAKTSFENKKQEYMNMSLEERKKSFKSTTKSINEIPTWAEYWFKNKSIISVKVSNQNAKAGMDVAKKISFWMGDITTLEVDAIVNAANSVLIPGGGVDGAIHKAAGPYLKMECATLGRCPAGEAKITGGYSLPAKYVIHTVGPVGKIPEVLEKCYKNCLDLAKVYGLRTIAFPCISTGVYGYPQEAAARVALSTVTNYLINDIDSMDRVIFCLFLNSDKEIYEKLLPSYFDLN
ncbi:PREDICTED: macro domain-containing protein CT2219-like [Polistes dominula]|uniref:Macro domain-containing protein CT2219-like n=1 Tax=Polistes dominula TaxID=743375 RepID=A0ABM1IE00_POLDO|nr:PREDICTED: macro domain-containing protein CT2219-like [Polistes dominula]